ncbi:MAG: tRNA (adenosine(37)-N6)-threonylcarbamoyltransferase complex ATPase subunit type 1 TsaE [Bacteroidales bacterium]|jgi:tRNA threonylcarbamoyladenosine biosynthesis protein TsaE|nr:tRNA (adenosine(37)-N6)-threonylcarbamoyltransferase complex ATPase subunit type 1 TsaE [Bacteroidales bacterium]
MTEEGKDILKTFTITSLEEIDKVAGDFIQYISESDLQSNIFAFYGKMGAGKTTFIKAICKVLGVKDIVNSPTFTIINEYKSAKGFPIYHFDFYRINRIQEAFDIGTEDYFAGNGLCLIEWPEKIAEILPEDHIKVTISTNEDLSRTVEIS